MAEESTGSSVAGVWLRSVGERCYGKHGKAYIHTPPRHSDLELVLMNENRQLWNAPGRYEKGRKYLTEAVETRSG